jgi:hypothetical protein
MLNDESLERCQETAMVTENAYANKQLVMWLKWLSVADMMRYVFDSRVSEAFGINQT